MPDTRTVITVNGAPLSPFDAQRIQSVHIEEALGSPDKASVAVSMETDYVSNWTSPLDALVAPAAPFTVELNRGSGPGASYSLEARSVSASWNLVPGGLSTLTVEGMDRSVDLDRREEQKLWQDTTDSAIARSLFEKYGLAADIGQSPSGPDSDVYSPQQQGTDWSFLRTLAARNGFDLHVETVRGAVTGVFKRIDPRAEPQGVLDLGYGPLGGSATAQVQLLSGQEVHVTRAVPGSDRVDRASDPGTGQAMAAVSLGGATVVRASTADGTAVTDAQTTATAMAERSAFGATLSATLTAPDAPLVRARRTVTVRGLGAHLDGLWLVRSVTHSITQGGHTQALTLIRNALGRLDAKGGRSAGGLAAARAAGGVL